MKKLFLRIRCYNHKFPFEHIVGWTTEFENIIKCELCGKIIYTPFLTASTDNIKMEYVDYDKANQ